MSLLRFKKTLTPFILMMCNKEVLMDLKKDFGLRLKELRTKKGITQYQLAEMVGVDPKHMSHIETGRSFPKADLIEKFAKALDINYMNLFKSEHLLERDMIIDKLETYIKKSSDDELKIIYKIISGVMDV